VKHAIGHWTSIIGILDATYFDAEGKAILAAVIAAKKEFPDFVLGIDYTLDTDWSGDLGIWIWVIIPDETDPDSEDFRQFVSWCPRAAWNAIARLKSDRLPYTHYRLLSGAIEAVSGGAHEPV